MSDSMVQASEERKTGSGPARNAAVRSRPVRPRGLSGAVDVPGDKSISHRAIIMGGLAVGETKIEGLLEGEDVHRTAAALRALGADVRRHGAGSWSVRGCGVGGFGEPDDVLEMGNSGTAARLLLGAVASTRLTAFFTGDASLRSRPMQRVVDPLSQMGARFLSRGGSRLPLAIVGAADPVPIEYRPPVASAQVKSAVLLAGLNCPGRTTVVEPHPTRDHTERMLRHFGATLTVADEDGGRRITLEGQPELEGREVVVPGDPSSAAFPLVAALIVPGSEITLRNVGLNPGRAGLFETLAEMGADITMTDRRDAGGEPVADLVVRAGRLRGVDVPAERAPSMIDEYPILAVAAAVAEGRTRMRGLAELRVKESDRLGGMAEGLAACGVAVAVEGDDLIVDGGRRIAGGATIRSRLDHRIAMAFLTLGMAAEEAVSVDDASPIATSFPGFASLMNGLGAAIEGV